MNANVSWQEKPLLRTESQTWVLKEGRELRFDPLSQEPIYSKYFSEKRYEGFSEDPYVMEASQKGIQDLSYRELGAFTSL